MKPNKWTLVLVVALMGCSRGPAQHEPEIEDAVARAKEDVERLYVEAQDCFVILQAASMLSRPGERTETTVYSSSRGYLEGVGRAAGRSKEAIATDIDVAMQRFGRSLEGLPDTNARIGMIRDRTAECV